MCSRLYGDTGAAMLNKLTDNIIECLTHAAEAQARADQATDLADKLEHAKMATRWRRLAESYQFVERITAYLDNIKTIGSAGARED